MWWFSKGKRKEIWDENIQWPIGDIEAAHRIRDICRSAADSAEKVVGFADRPDSKKNNYETERYERAAKVAMEIAIKERENGGQFGGFFPGGANFALCDGSVRVFTPRTTPGVLLRMATIAGGENEPLPGD